MQNQYNILSENKNIKNGISSLRLFLNDQVFNKKIQKAPKIIPTIQYKLEKELINDKIKDDFKKLKQKENLIELPITKSINKDKRKTKTNPKIRYIIFEEKLFDINQIEKNEDGLKNKIKFANPKYIYLKDTNEKNRKIAMDQILEGVFKDKKYEIKKLNKVTSVPFFRKPFSSSESSSNLNKLKNERTEVKSLNLNPNNNNFYTLCEINDIITLDQKMDYYLLLKQYPNNAFPDIRVETANNNTRNSRESGRFKAKNSESNDRSSFQKSDKKEQSFSSSSRGANDINQKYINDLKTKYKILEDVLENYLNEINSKYITFREGFKNFDNLNYIDKIKLVMKAREIISHRVILKDSELTVERMCYMIYKKCIDFKILSHIDVSKNSLGDHGCMYLLYLIDLYSKHLNYLNISYNKIGKQSVDMLVNILQKNFISLSALNISGNSLGDKLFCEICVGISKNNSIERFWACNNSMEKDSCLIIGTILRYDKKMKLLDISKNNFNDDCLHDLLKGLISNYTLEVLVLNECNMTNLSFKILDVVMQLNTSLKELYLERNKLNDLSCEKISDIFNKNEFIEILSLLGNKINNEGIEIIIDRQRKIPIKVIGIKELYAHKFNHPFIITNSNYNMIFEFF